MARMRRRDRKAGRLSLRSGKRRWILGVVVSTLAACGSEREEPVLVLHADPPKPEVAQRPTPAAGSSSATEEVKTDEQVADSSVRVASVEAVARRRVTYEEAESSFRVGEYGEATDLFEAYVERVPTNAWGHYMLGLSAWRSGDPGRAESALRRTLELDPGHGKATLNLARVLLEQQRPGEAMELAGRFVDASPELGEGWRVLGNAHAELGEREEASEAYRRAIALDPDDAWTLNNLGLLRIQMGDHVGALGPLSRATELRPGVALFQNNFGAALEKGGYLTEAAEAFQAALDSEPGYEKARLSLERVRERGPSTPLMSAELSELSSRFTAEIRRWQREGGVERPREEGEGLQPGG